MITRREALWGAIRALGGAAIAFIAPFPLRAQEFTRTYKGTTTLFRHHTDLYGGSWVGSFWGRKKLYALASMDSVPRGLQMLERTCRNTIDMHLRETGYVP